jgi:hypothetical protein
MKSYCNVYGAASRPEVVRTAVYNKTLKAAARLYVRYCHSAPHVAKL